MNPAERALAGAALFELRLGLEALDTNIVEVVQTVALSLGTDTNIEIPSPPWPEPPSFIDRLLRTLEDDLMSGRILVEREVIQPLRERDDLLPSILPPLPPAQPERPDTFFEVRFVDEIGQALSGLDVLFRTDDAPHEESTNAAGVALLENVVASSASIEPPESKALAEALGQRWTKQRSGRPPNESNTTEIVFEGQTVAPLAIKAAVPNTVVLKPPRGKLFVELYDKRGRVRHANRNYSIEGPQTFEGTTDELGRFLHEGVFPGDYKLTLTLEFFEGADQVTDTYETPLVVLDDAIASPELRMLGTVPASVLVRLNMFFNTNKTFLLPTALPGIRKLREVYTANSPGELLVVGHADTSGGAAFNDKLSLERAQATIAFLKDDVDTWLAFYSDATPKLKRWGGAEDRMMLVSLPDFDQKPKGEDAVRWFQRTRGLGLDGKAGPETRRQLIKEYMALDEAKLDPEEFEIAATAHGCGENFPLDSTGEQLDEAPRDGERDPLDRRVELFFFEPEFGIAPKPPGENSKPASHEYPKWRESVVQTIEIDADDPDLPLVTFVEILDGLFRSNSAVVLPEAEAPSKDERGARSLTSVGLFATALRFNQENPGKKVFVAGHCDTTNTVDFNQKLSKERAQAVLALLLGGDAQREVWKKLCDGRHQVSDYKQILAWVSRAFAELGFDCDPGTIDDNEKTAVAPVKRFQAAYNRNKDALGATAPNLEIDGDVGPLTWGAIFDCYEAALRDELGEDAAGLRALRDGLRFVDDARRALGFSEYFPVEELGVDNFKSQANRRAEVLFFDSGEEPDLAAAENDPETADLYLPGHFVRAPLEPMLSAKPWKASWDATSANQSTPRIMQLSAPGLPSGEAVTLTLQVNGEPLRIFDVVSNDDGASFTYQDWDIPDEIDPVSLEAGAKFDPVVYDFLVEGGGRSLVSSNRVTYADRIFVQLELDPSDGDPLRILTNERYVLQTPWGERSGQSDARGIVDENGIPPGGASLLLRGRYLVHLGVLPHNWDADQ